jgi:hypothetical protein
MVGNEFFFTTDVCNELWKLQGDIDRWILQAPVGVPYSLMLVDRPDPRTPRVFRRGNPLSLGEKVPRQFLSFLSASDARPFEIGSGRLELARAIVQPDHPLTARVLVNRVWLHHFGTGLVRTPSDFGLRSEPPTHPDLLDELSLDLVDEGWSLKWLHRQLVTSASYRQASSTNIDPKSSERDPEARLFSRRLARRLSFEEWRDASLATTEEIDLSIGGRPEEMFASPPTRRRAIYGRIDRQFLPATLRIFDFANPDLHIPQRGETTVPQQALFFLNNPFVIARARQLASTLLAEMSPADRVEALYRRTMQRAPSTSEAEAMIRFVSMPTGDAPQPATLPWSYGFAQFDGRAGSLGEFTPLPYFTGKAWQGGPEYPDASLGWAQLSAEGGHAGNDHQHAVVRRFTAPRDLVLRIRSVLRHPVAVGDGVLAAIFVDGQARLTTHALDSKVTLDLEPVSVKKGATIDFVVDLRESLNHEEFEWSVDLADTQGTETWNSTRDFAGTRSDHLTPWEQLAQVLLTSNEFLFVD